MLHLLRESSIERAVAAFPECSHDYEKNIETLRRLGTRRLAAFVVTETVRLPGNKCFNAVAVAVGSFVQQLRTQSSP